VTGAAEAGITDPADLPLGAVIATAVLYRCPPITSEGIATLRAARPDEFAFGLYTPGRFAWILRDVQPLPEPVAFRGKQGFFEVPDELLGVERQREVPLSEAEARGPS
jgi:hypothetical protein